MITDVSVVTMPLILMTLAILGIMIATRFMSVQIISFIEKKYKQHALLISTMLPRGFVATLLAFLPYNEGIIIPTFTEIVLLLIFSTAIVSIFGNILFRTANEKEKKRKLEEKEAKEKKSSKNNTKN
jgi:NhaP-type Na+/H+ or K+/H+ antiporter